jgi:hypothetical protein
MESIKGSSSKWGIFGGVVIVTALAGMGFSQTASVSLSVSFFNQAIFVTQLTDLSAGATITSTDLARGCRALGTVRVNIDATTRYTVTARLSLLSTPEGARSSSGRIEDAVYLSGSPVCPNRGTPGSQVAFIGQGRTTAGTPGTDYTIYIGLFFSGPSPHLTSAPLGAYVASITLAVTD